MPFPVDPSYVERAEQRLGVKFPQPYRQRILRENGGEIAIDEDGEDFWELFPVCDDSDQTRLKRSWDDVVRHTERERDRPDYPDGAIAIGEDGGGNLLLLVPRSGELQPEGWDHETGETWPIPPAAFGD